MKHWDNRKRSQRQEAQLATQYGGKVQPCSGARPHSKGDVKTENLLIEAKTSNHEGYRLTVATWQKIQDEAALEGKVGVMIIELNGHRMCVVPENVLQAYTEESR